MPKKLMASDLMIRLPLLIFALLLAQAAQAESIADPTRPLFGGGDAVAGDAVEQEPVVRGLTSVIIADKKCAAIIDGKTIVLGGKYGAEKLVEVNERGIVLQGANGTRTLTLFPTVGIKVSVDNRERPAAKCSLAGSRQEKGQPEQDDRKEKK